MIDVERRRRVMGRSIQLGHCICNPKQKCPCDIFKQKNVCLCAGERLPEEETEIKLTRLVENAGCASKIDQVDLKEILANLPEILDPRVIVGASAADDAGIYALSDELALVQTVDVFTPNVDDPYVFGQIAAANSVSDVYAMGGQPLTALSIISFPIDRLPKRVMEAILRGGLDKLKEAETIVLGGHSLKDEEIKFGFAVTGLINPKKIITNKGARPGDILVLTKPLGTGVLSFAHQIGRAPEEGFKAAIKSMIELNREAAEVMVSVGVRASTDITGFGLLGHLSEIVSSGNISALSLIHI
ncbi:MAG: selenide, water dikinase SelD, partial [Candidatus Aminicenantes bacterium]|nr:selenide, water dikinase SelD [Candidatus Aminicenantes bacterium]